MAQARIPIKTEYDGSGFDQAQKDAERLAKEQERLKRAAVAETRRSIADKRRLTSLSTALDADLAREARKLSQVQLAAAREAEAAAAAAAQKTNQRNQAIIAGGAVVAAAAVYQLRDFAMESIELARVQAEAEAQLGAAIKSTGGAAGLTAGELKRLASEMQSVTNYGDEATIAAEALLLTFTNVQGEIFTRAVPAILDMSTAMGQDLKSSTIQLGKALNDPIAGVSALSRVGVQFTAEQHKMIEALVETGRTAEAQGVILAEIERQFGGSAAAAREADGGYTALKNSYGDLKEALGALITPTGAFNQLLIDQLDATTRALNGLSGLSQVWNKMHETGNQTVDTLFSMDTAARALVNPAGVLIQFISGVTHNTEEWAAAAMEVAEAADTATAATETNTAATNDNADALAAAAERLDEVNRIRRDAAREMVGIEEQAQADSAEAWEDYYDDRAKAGRDAAKRLSEIQADYAGDMRRIESDLQKDLARLNKDTAREMARINADETKQISDVQEKAAKEQSYERRRDQVDALADERLFNFELQQLAAEGQGNRIREMIERRAIEEQIAREKAEVEGQIEAEKLADEVDRIREAADEKREQLRDESAERRQLLEEEAAEARELRQQQFEQEVEDEKESLAERLTALEEYRGEKLAGIEAGKADAIAALGRELAEAGDLTERELGQLVGVAEAMGYNVGKSFADGISKGYETNQQVDQLLGAGRAVGRTARGALGGMPQFDVGGVVPGPVGAPVVAVVHGGEQITPVSQAGSGGGGNSVTITINNPVFGNAVSSEDIMGYFQEYTDTVLVPAFQ
jgi:hypothetical protein